MVRLVSVTTAVTTSAARSRRFSNDSKRLGFLVSRNMLASAFCRVKQGCAAFRVAALLVTSEHWST